MPAKGTTYSSDLLSLIFNAVTFSNVAINATAGPLTNLWVSLHTASPGAGGAQTSNEATFGGYSRVAVTRTSAGWTVSTNSVSPAANITFPQATSGSETESFFGVGAASTGAGTLFYYGTISPVIVVSSGVQSILQSSSLITEV